MSANGPITDKELTRRSRRYARAEKSRRLRLAERNDAIRQAFIERLEQAAEEERPNDRGIRVGIAKASKMSVSLLGQILDPPAR
jgi:hypothetical protein